jgi:hypothetical protein
MRQDPEQAIGKEGDGLTRIDPVGRLANHKARQGEED